MACRALCATIALGSTNSREVDVRVKPEYLFGMGFAVVIAVAAGVIGTYLFGSRKSSSATGDGKFHYVCTNPKCGREFSMNKRTTRIRVIEAGESPDEIRMTCPLCKSDRWTVLMRWCPKCEKYFGPAGVTKPEDLRPEATRPPLWICPDCGKEPHDWRLEMGH